LDGVPQDGRATYIVVARDPRDMYVSLYHQGDNIDRDAVRRLLGQPERAPDDVRPERPPLDQALEAWIGRDDSPQQSMDSIRGVFHHVTDAWRRRETQSNVLLVHYDDLLHDLDGQMRDLAARLGLDVAEKRWPELVDAATFTTMRERASAVVPDTAGVLKDANAFFRRGSSGAWRDVMTAEQVEHYWRRVDGLAPPEVVAWLHR
jgi:hypothetical protein